MFTNLVRVEYPPEAQAGELVTIRVFIKNVYSVAIYIAPVALVNDTIPVVFSVTSGVAQPGVTYYFEGTFTMPSENAVITAYCGYWGEDQAWHWEDTLTVTVNLTGVVGELDASIFSKKLKIGYSETELPIPRSGVEQGQSGLMFVEVRNDSLENAKLFITWTISGGPNNDIKETYDDWEMGTTNPGSTHQFIGDRFTFDEVGAYVIHIQVYVEGVDGPVDDFVGEIATVEAAVDVETLEVDITIIGTGHVITLPASIEGKTTWHHNDTGTFPSGTDVRVTAVPNAGYEFDHWSDEIVGGVSTSNPAYVQPMTERRTVKAHFVEIGNGNGNGNGGVYSGIIESLNVLVGAGSLFGTTLNEFTPPVADIKEGQEFKIKMIAKNTSDETVKMGIHYVITKPDGSVIDRTEFEIIPDTVAGELHEFIEPGIAVIGIDQIGDWSLMVELLAEDPTNVLDTRSIVLFTGVTESTGGFSQLGEMIPMLILVMMMSMMMQVMEDPMGVTIKVVEGAGKAVAAVKTKGKSLLG